MIRPDPRDLQVMYPPMTEDFSRRMQALLRSLPAMEEEKPMKQTLRTALVCAILLALMASTAFALTRPDVLRWLLGDRPASPQLEQTAQTIVSQASADSITVRVTSIVYDGNQFALTYELENAEPDRPALVALDPAIRLDGADAALRYSTVDLNAPRLIPSPHLDVLPVRRNPLTGGGWSKRLAAPLSGLVECELTFVVYRPIKGLAVPLEADDALLNPEEYDPSTRSELKDSLHTLLSFRDTHLLLIPGEDPQAWADAGYTLIDRSGEPLSSPADDATLQETARIALRFTFDADNAICHDFSGAQAAREDCRVKAAAFRLTPLETFFNVYLIPAENTREAAQALAARHGEWAILDGNGQPVQYSEMDHLYSLTPDVVEIDGQWVCRYTESMPGLLTFPEEVVFQTEAGELLRFAIH